MKKSIFTLIVIAGALNAFAFPGDMSFKTSGPQTCFTTLTGGGTGARLVDNLNVNLGGSARASITPTQLARVNLNQEVLLGTIDWFNGGGTAARTNVQLGLIFRTASNATQRGDGLVDFDMSWTGSTSGHIKTASFPAIANHGVATVDGRSYRIQLTRAYSQNVNWMQWGKAQVYGRLIQTTPEPSTLAFMGLGAIALVRRKKASAAS